MDLKFINIFDKNVGRGSGWRLLEKVGGVAN
jgi:hypothetical protein